MSPVSALKANPRTAIRYETAEVSVIHHTYGVSETRTNLASNSVEQGIHNLLRKSPLLVLVHLHHLPPVGSDLGQVEALTQVHQVQDVLLETRTTKPDGSLQEFRADTRIEADGVSDFVDVSTGGFADSREGVNGGDTLSEHSVGGEFGQLR